MNRDALKGMVPPLVVPFTKKQEIDEAAFREDLRYLIASGIDGISSGGSTGEGVLLSDAELRRCLELVGEENNGVLPVYAGIIRNATRDVIRAGLDAKSLGASALLVTPVFYHSATEDENFDFFRDIGEKVKLPVIIYNVVPTNLISPELFRRIAALDWIAGIKQVDPVDLARITATVTNSNVYAACDHMLYGSYVSGACGAISALITVAPHLCIQQWRAFQKGDQQEAMRIHRLLVPIVDAYFRLPFPGKIKALLNLQGRRGGLPRRPMQIPSDQRSLTDMKAALKKAGLLREEMA